MKINAVTLLLLFMLATFSSHSCQWTQYLGDSGRTAYSQCNAPQTPTLLWRTYISEAFVAPPFVTDREVIAFLRDSYQFFPYPSQEKSAIVRIDLLTGELLDRIESENSPFWSVFLIGEEIFAKRGGDLLRVDFQSQEITKVASIPTECPPFLECYPVVLRDRLIFPTTSVTCLSRKDWRTLWELKSLVTEGTTEDDILSIVADDLTTFVIMGDTSEKNSILAVDSQTGSLLWSISSTNVTELALDGTLFAAGENLCALNSETGELIWEFELDYFVASNVVVGPETICVADRGNFLYAVDRTTGVLKWKTEWEGITTGPIVQPHDFLIGGKGTIFCVGNLWDQGSIISAFNARDGSLFWKFFADLRSPPVLSEGIFILNTIGGEIFAFTTEPDIFARQGQLLMEKGCSSCALYAFTKARELYIQRDDQGSAQALETVIQTCREGIEPKEIVILTNSIDMPAAQELGLVFEDMGFHVVYSFPKDFSTYQKTSNKIVILGGPDAYEGVGDLVQRVLISSQEEMLRKMPVVWVASKPWSTDQLVVVIGGPDRSQTVVATEEFRGLILCLVCCS